MKKLLYSLVVMLSLGALFRVPVSAEDIKSTTLYPAADATIIDGDSTNEGGTSTLTCQHDEDTKVFFIRFDLGVIPSNAIIQNATLVLTQTAASGDDVSVNAYKVTTSWSETTISGTNKPSFDSGVTYGILSVDSSTGPKYFPQNFSDLVQAWLYDSSSNFGLYFEATSSATYTHDFGSRESGNKPSLSIDYTLADTEGPVISNLDISDITYSSIKISWQTDEEASSYVDFGLSSSYGKVMGSEDLVKSHLVELTALNPNITYHFRVRSKDLEGNESASGDQTFKTLKDGTEEQPDKSDETISDEILPPGSLKLTSGKEEDKPYVELNWEHSQTMGIEGYRIYRSEEDSMSYVLLTEVGSDKTYYKDETVEKGKTYFYVVRAVLGDEESADSNEEVVTIYANELEEEIHSLSFWKGFIIFNVIVLPIFAFLYLRYRKKSKKLKGQRKLESKSKGRKK